MITPVNQPPSKFNYYLKRLMLKRKRHAQFISLGYNCELAYRYVLRNKFLDSNLFAWSYAYSLDDLIVTLENLDQLFAGHIYDPDPLYECANTHIRMHGKLDMTNWFGGITDKNRALMESDKADLVQRVAHLKKKLINWLMSAQSSDALLIAYKIRTTEWFSANATDKLLRLRKVLQELGSGKFTLLIVCEQCCMKNSHNLPEDILVRYVAAFNPDDQVATNKIGDKFGWRLIFDEFVPRVHQRKRHKFKFEKE